VVVDLDIHLLPDKMVVQVVVQVVKDQEVIMVEQEIHLQQLQLKENQVEMEAQDQVVELVVVAVELLQQGEDVRSGDPADGGDGGIGSFVEMHFLDQQRQVWTPDLI
jgi:hypothetical protein